MFARQRRSRRRARRAGIPAIGAALLVGLLPAQSLAMPPDPANIETGRETLATDPLKLETLEVEKPVDGQTFEKDLNTLKAENPTDLQQAPAGTTTTPAPATASFTFGSAVSPASLTTATTTATAEEGPLTQIPNLPVLAGKAADQPAPTGTWQFSVLDRSTVDRSTDTSKNVEEALKVGALVTVQAPVTGSVPIDVALNYKSFELLHGADWASRLRLVQFPECYLTTPLDEACQAYEELETVNDPVAHTVKATVDTAADGTVTPTSTSGTTQPGPAVMQASYTTATPAATGGDKALIGAVDSGAGAGGSFKATPLASSGTWSAGGSSGAFTWSYPITLPPAPAGPAPNVTLSYNSQTVDGKTAVSSPQASWIGEGWDYSPGFIERRYRPCKDDTHKLDEVLPNNTTKAGKTNDLCWVSYNAVMSLGGSTNELVRDASSTPETGTETYHLQRDDGTRIEHRTRTTEGSTANGDNNGEYWTVTTTDGTKYHFGLNKVDGGHADTNSVSTVPVFGNHSGEPCHVDAFADSRCGTDPATNKPRQQAWRWGLDKVEDVHGNIMIVNWKQETNYYAVRDKRNTPEQYERAAYPTSIEYGIRVNALTNALTKPSATVEFGVQQRCLKSTTACAAANFDKTGDPGAYRPWWDTPGSLNCKSTSKLCPGFPSFWTQVRLDTVTTKAARAGQTGLGYVDVYTLHQSFPEDWYDTSPGLWLNSITRTGYGPGETPPNGGTAQSKDGVSFAHYQVKSTSPLKGDLKGDLKDKQLPNLVPRSSDDTRPAFTRPRIGVVATEAGADIEVEYTGGCPAEPAADAGKANGTCYPVRWSPDGEEKTPAKAWFNKYVVASVTETDKVATLFNTPITTSYTYSGPAWAKSEDEFLRPALRTYSDWRGYRQVTVDKGRETTGNSTIPPSQSRSVTRYFLGTGGEVTDSIDGTVLLADDAPQYAGMTAETLTYLNSHKKPSEFTTRTRTFPDKSDKTASRARQAEDGTPLTALDAYRTGVKKTDTMQSVGTSWRGIRTTTLDRDATYGLPTAVESTVITPNGTGGETPSEPTCTKTTYVHNTGVWLIGLPSSVRTTATTCANHDTADPATELKGSVQTSYDGLAYGATPTKGLVTAVDQIDGTGTTHSITTTTTYDPLGRTRTMTAPGVGTTETQYLPGGDDGGPVTSTKTIKTVNAKNLTTTTTYDPGRALPLTVTDPNNRVTRTEYDDLGRLTKGWSASRSAGTQTANVDITYQPAIATPSETRPAAVTVKTLKDDGTYASQVTIYDGLMRQVQTQSEAHGPGRIVTDTHYNDHGLVSEQTGGYLAKGEPTTELFKVQSPTLVPNSVKTTYDGLERPVWQTPYYGQLRQTPTITTYNADTSVTVDPAGSTNPTITTVADALGRVTQVKHHTGSGNTRTTTYTYDKRGNRNKVTDPAGNAWTYIYDARGRVTTTKDPDTGTTQTQYDDADRPKVVTDELQQSIYTTYDTLGRVTAVSAGTTTAKPIKKFTYDQDGALGLPYEAKRITPTGDEYIDRITGYDTEYRPTGRQTVIPQNAMTTGLDGTYTYSYTYTPTGKPLSVTLPAKGGLAAEKVITRYNEDGLPESTSGLTWYTSDTTYSPYGEVLRSVSSAQPYRVWTTNFIDEHTGRLQRTVTDRETAGPHRVSDTGYAYDASGMITASARQNTETPTLTTWDNQCFTYDAMGELVNAWTSNITPNGKGTGCKAASGATWGYNSTGAPSSGPVADAAHQPPKNADGQPTPAPAGLVDTAPAAGTVASGTAVTGSAAYRQSFTYDWLGNRTKVTDHDPAGDTSKNTNYTYTYSSTQPHTLTSATSPTAGTSSTYAYNANGTTRTRTILGGTQTQTLQWTAEQKLESNTIGNSTITYVYDAAGNRLLESSPTGSTLYLGETELTTDSVGLITRASRSYTQAGTPTITRTTNGSPTTSHKLAVLLADHLGTSNTTVEISNTQPVTRRFFKPYGELRGSKPADWPNKRSYLGVGIDDTTTGLTHIGAREYDQNTGRFLSADPIIHFDDPLQMNGYTYANNSPVTFSDPTGLELGSTPGTCSWDISYCTPDQKSGKDKNTGARDNSGPGAGPTKPSQDKAPAKPPVKGKKPSIAGMEIPSPEDMPHHGIFTSNYLDAIHMWAIKKCGSSSGASDPHNGAFCTEASDLGLLDSRHPWVGVAMAAIGTCTLAAEACLAIATDFILGEIEFAAGGSATAGAAGVVGAPLLERAGAKLRGLFTRGCNCFLAGTDVLMADGSTKDIEDIKIGDKVSATDPKTGKSGSRKVTRLIRTDSDKHFNELTIATEDGPHKLTATHEHPFWSPSEKQWVEAGALRPGMTLLSDDGTTVTVEKNRPFSRHARTYNLTVEDIHTYYVLAGATPVLVHNSSCMEPMLDDMGEAYVRRRHFPGGAEVDDSKGLFLDGVDLDGLVEKSLGSNPSSPNAAGFYERVVNAGQLIGVTSRNSGSQPTSWFMLVQDKYGSVRTMYPIPSR
ncbi:intein/intein/RHS repeat-associated protein [Streptomyces sp. PanSC19]|uniref:polymorphic toxin-type HINT domain-containing protein n=1 Tax=Streptomyces sp. PanSC19 TaxID=1520455 RepID=UPI000FBD0170|nr:polymorphic toxin-type HINT domain-containing protein [Streptomyces sp. PanSC19]ROQ23617.1 intein/intein/RHS repeat-associated protein [Streptomyces sp. PanSC19]